MPAFDATTEEKIAIIRGLHRLGTTVEVYELVKIDWPSPDGAIYYGTTQVDELSDPPPPVSPVEARLIPESIPEMFYDLVRGATIGDEEVELEMWDADGAVSDLLVTHTEGVQVEFYSWFPQAELLLKTWIGHLRFEDEAAVDVVRVKAVQGYRSVEGEIPDRAHYQQCQRVFGGLLTTQAEINEHGCPYNKHIGGLIGTNDPATGLPWTFCDRREPASCTARGVNPLFHLSHRTIQSVVVNNQTSGPRIFSTSQGNETNLKEPVRVVMGKRRIYDMKVMVYRRDLNNNTPDRGWFLAQYEACEGPVRSITGARVTVANETQNVIATHYGYRLGNIAQGAVNPNLTPHNYSDTALIMYNFGWIDPTTASQDNASASAIVEGLNDIRVYTDAETYTEEYTTNRVWQLARVLCDKRWGYGLDYAMLDIDSFIAAAAWADDIVRYTDVNGDDWDHTRARSDVELIARKVQQQIDDLCMAGRLSRPFLFNGKIHVVPLAALTEEELAACPVFTDEGDEPNILWESADDAERSTLKISRKSSYDLPNRVECTIDDITEDYRQVPLQPVEDIDAQLAAGRVRGDRSRKINVKKISPLGVVEEAQAVKLQWSVLDLGEFDEGGLANNCRVQFSIWHIDELDLFPHKVIRVVSSRLERYGFEYFRILPEGIRRQSDLEVTIEAQAYPVAYMDTFETILSTLPGPPVPPNPEPPGPVPIPCVLEFGTVSYENGLLTIPIPQC